MSTASEKDRELIITRVVNAPREKVWKVWTVEEHVQQWWGPAGFTNTVHAMDVRPGGTWRYTMHGADGIDYENVVNYLEVYPPERLVYMHGGGEDDPQAPFHATVTFEDLGGTTKVTLRLLIDTVEQRDALVEFGAIEGGESTMDCLEAYLAAL